MRDIAAFIGARATDHEQAAPYSHADGCDNRIARGYDSCSCDVPGRMLREAAAYRAILDLHADTHDCGDPRSYEYPYVGCATARALAGIWREHPDYDPAWETVLD